MVALKPQTVMYAAGALAVLAAAWYVKNKAAVALNPFSPENIAYKMTSGGYQYLTGSPDTIGTAFYGATHGGALDVTAADNIGYRAINGSWRLVGVLDEHETIGTKVYDGVQWIKSFF